MQVSIVDAANPLVFVKAQDVGLTGKELPKEINQNPEILQKLEAIRGTAAVLLGLVDKPEESAWVTPGIPKMTFVAEAADYTASDGTQVAKNAVDLLSRMMSMQKAHPSYAMTGAMCTAAAAVVPGSIVAQVLSPEADTENLRIGHASGVLSCGVDYLHKEVPEILDTFGYRTANLLLDGTAVIRLA